MDLSKKSGGNFPSKRLFFATDILLILLLVFSLSAFISSYHQLRTSIQSERAESVRQISALISDRVSQLRNTYIDVVEQAAQVVENSGAQSLPALSALLKDGGRILLVDEKGNYTALDGSSRLIDDTELLKGLYASSAVTTSFATVQEQGDFWLFARPLRDVAIGGVPYIGVVLTVSAREYADVATISLYDQLGESLVVAQDGTIKMRPTAQEATSSFGGYSILNILQDSSLSPEALAAFAQALQNGQEYSFSCTMKNVTWLVQSLPSDNGRSIVVVVPVSLTAESTYSGLSTTLIHIVVTAVMLSLLFLFNFTVVLRKNQRSEVEHARAKSKSDFLDKMSHDIRTPLNAIVGMHELALQSMDDTATVYDCLTKAKKSSDYLVGVINDVLDMSRIESGKMTVAHKPFDLSALLESVVEIESSAAAEKGLSLRLETDAPITCDFVGDAQRLRQCLMNLVNNAIKFTPADGHVVLSFAGEPLDEAHFLAKFGVTDDGVGMSEAFMKNLFQPFEQEQNSLYNTYAGSGLGLSIVHEFVSLMGGTITAHSQKGEGSTFCILLPLEMTAKDAARAAAPSDAALLRQLAGKRVLLAEDNAINRQIISLLLAKMGLGVDEAENGRAAADRFLASAPGTYSLILMDIMMPVMGGLEATRVIRAGGHPDSARIPIVALSANAFEEDAKKSLEAGMQMHLAKPVDLTELKRVLKKYVC